MKDKLKQIIRNALDHEGNASQYQLENRTNLLLNDILELISLNAKKIKDNWISVKDRLPEDNVSVLVYSDYGDHGDIWVSNDKKYFIMNCVTHWMPLPEKPDEK